MSEDGQRQMLALGWTLQTLIVILVRIKHGLPTGPDCKLFSDPHQKKELALEYKSTTLLNTLFSSSDIF